MHQVSDRMNTNERVFIRHPSKGSHVCVVTFERQLMFGSSFAIVITGGFTQLPLSQVCVCNQHTRHLSIPYACFTFQSFDCSCSCDKASPAPTAACMGTATLPPVSYPLQRANATSAGLELCVIYPLSCSLPAPTAVFPCN